MVASASAELGPIRDEDATIPDAATIRLATSCRADRRDEMALRLLVVVLVWEDDGLVLNACADETTSTKAKARSAVLKFAMMVSSDGRQRMGRRAAACGEAHGRLTLRILT